MVQRNFLLPCLFAVTVLSTGTSARDCYTNGYRGSSWLEVKTPQQLHQFEGCTTIIGTLKIVHSWTGPFFLPGVKNITGMLGAIGAVSSIELPDLEYAEKVLLLEQYPVKRLLLPRLKHVEKLYMYQRKGFSFDLGALESAGEIRMDGPWSNVSFPSLEETEGRLSFETQWSGNRTPYRDTAPVDIELPVLRQVGELILAGDITSLSIPSLEVVGNGGLTVEAQQATLPVLSLPSLKGLETLLSIRGYITSVDLGPLETTKAAMYIHTYIPVEVHSELYETGNINMGGELKTLNFTRLLDADSMAIRSNIPTECSDHVVWTYRYLHRPQEAGFCDDQSLIRAGRNSWADLNSPTPSSEPTPKPTPDWYTRPSSRPFPSPSPSPRPGLGSGAEVVIVAVFGVIFSLSIISFCMSRAKRMELPEEFEEETRHPLSKAEMEAADEEEMDRLFHGEFEDDYFDAPPPYAKHVRG